MVLVGMAGCGRIAFDPLGDCTLRDPIDSPYANSSTGGDGTSADTAFLICTEAQLSQIAQHPEHWASYFRLGADIDLTAPFVPIASQDVPFSGDFAGHGHAIDRLEIDSPLASDVGMFAVLGDGARIRELSLTGVDVRGNDNVGALAGTAYGGTIANVSVAGTITGDTSVGGAVGYVNTSQLPFVMTNVSVAILVDASGDSGGVLGLVAADPAAPAQLSGLSAAGEVRGSAWIGGVVGALNGDATLDTSASSAKVTAGRIAGGLVGTSVSDTVISRSSSSSDVTCTQYSCGGLVGESESIVTHCSASGRIMCGDIYCAGLIGASLDTVEYSYATGEVMGTDYAAGLIGNSNSESVHDCYATGDVTGTAYVAGLIASQVSGVLERTYATGRATSSGDVVGGLVAEGGTPNSALAIRDSFATGNVRGASATSKVSPMIGATRGSVTSTELYHLDTATCTNTAGACTFSSTPRSVVLLQSSASPPTASWDFTNVWREVPGAFPQLR